MNALIISNVHREPLIAPHIEYLNPVRSLTPDYPHPQIGHCRCFHGHTNALLAYMTDDSAIVFEDDCVPDHNYDWKEVIRVAQKMVEESGWEFACLHGRGFDYQMFNQFHAKGLDWLSPNTEHQWVLGTLVYAINRDGARKFCSVDYWAGGCNIDLFVWSKRHNYCLLDPRQFGGNSTIEHPKPFDHNRTQGSLLENGRNIDPVYR